MIISVNAANIRAGASTNYKIVGVVYRGAKLTVVGKSGTWYKVKYGNGTGFIAGTLVKKG